MSRGEKSMFNWGCIQVELSEETQKWSSEIADEPEPGVWGFLSDCAPESFVSF